MKPTPTELPVTHQKTTLPTDAHKLLNLLRDGKATPLNQITQQLQIAEDETDAIVNILLQQQLVRAVVNDRQVWLVISVEGLKLLSNAYAAQPPTTNAENTEKGITFKQHLDESTNLITIFGILNAVILFATQSPIKVGESEAAVFIGTSMYALSILVLIEIISQTLRSNTKPWKFQAFYFLMCMTTLGMGMMFYHVYKPLLYVLLIVGIYFGLTGGLAWLLVNLFMIKPLRNVFSKYYNGIAFCLLLLSMITVGYLLKWLLPLTGWITK